MNENHKAPKEGETCTSCEDMRSIQIETREGWINWKAWSTFTFFAVLKPDVYRIEWQSRPNYFRGIRIIVPLPNVIFHSYGIGGKPNGGFNSLAYTLNRTIHGPLAPTRDISNYLSADICASNEYGVAIGFARGCLTISC